MLGAMSVVSDIKADSIRETIDLSYKVTDDVVYIIPDCDNMSSASANALLKVTEEPPKNAYFILTCENEENLLSTIRSRGVTYMLEPYTYEDKCDYIDTLNAGKQIFYNDEEEEFVLEVASNIGEVEQLITMDTFAFRDYVTLVIDNIAEVSDSNAFKIGDKVALKDEDNKYSVKLFWKAFNSVCVDRMRNGDDPLKYARAIGVTGDYAQQLNIRGINKQMLFDNWIIAIREEWL
jgi:DNA polymerase III delta prime subunit